MNEIKRLIAAERRDCIKYTLLLCDPRATRAERERYKGLQEWHKTQLEKWRNRL